jgi:hypothetical protein
MDSNPYLFNILAALLYLIVGVRLYALSRCTGGRPEYLLAINYLCCGISYLLGELPDLLEWDLAWILLTGRFLFALGMVPLLLFTRDVFRRDTPWATALVWVFSLLLFSGVTFSALEGDLEGVIITSIWFWFDWIGYSAPYVWITAEALLAYRAARRRARIGMCEAEIVNRFLLWALFGTLAALGGVLAVPLCHDYLATGYWPEWGDYTVGGVETASTVMLWLVFFPPAFYRRWVARAAQPAPVPPD